MPAGEHDLVRPAPHLLSTAVGDRLVVLDRVSSVCHVLNTSAGLVLETVDGTRTVGEVADLLHAETGVDREVLRTDVAATVASFRSAGLVLTDDEADPPAPAPVTAPTIDLRPGGDRWRATVRRRLESVDGAVTVGPVSLARSSVALVTNDEDAAGLLGAATASLLSSDRPDVVLWVLDRGTDGPRRWRVLLDDRPLGAAPDGSGAVELALAQLNQLAVAGSSGVLLHAGAVERDGRVVVVAGESGRGKSTLTAALVRSGLRYVTDELVVIDPDTAEVAPYPKALDLSARSFELLGLDDPPTVAKGRVPPSALGQVSDGGQLALLVLLGEPSAATGEGASPGDAASVEHLDAVDAVVELLPSTFAETFALPDALDVLVDLCDTTPVIRLGRGPLPEAVDAVRQAFED